MCDTFCVSLTGFVSINTNTIIDADEFLTFLTLRMLEGEIWLPNPSFNLGLAGLTGLSSYWQNEYHHLDTPPKNKDAHLTFYHSFMRTTSEVLTQRQASCRFRPLQLLEVSLFQESDHFHGLLVLFKAEYLTTGKEVTLETHIHPKHYYSVLDPKGSISRLQFLEVICDENSGHDATE